MEFHFTTYAIILIFTGVLLSVVAFIVWRQHAIPGRRAFALLTSTAAVLAFASAMEVAAIGVPAKIFWAKVEYLGTQSAAVLFLIFALQYTRRDGWLTRRRVLLLWVFPAATFLAVASNDWHRLIWNSFVPNPANETFLIYGHGTWFWLSTAYHYSLGLIAWIILYRAAVRTPRLYRRNIAILLVAAFVPALGAVLYLTGLNPIAGMDTTPLALALTGLILAGGIFGFGLFGLTPTARNVLVENMSDIVLVLDGQGLVVDINRAARKLIGYPDRPAIGQVVDSLLAFWPELLSRCDSLQPIQTEISLPGEPAQHFDLHVSPVYDRRRRLTGRIVVLHDITTRKQAEDALRRHVEKLGILNRINQAIASGLDLDQVLKTLHEQCAMVAPMDVFYVGLYEESTGLIHIPLYHERNRYREGPSRDVRQDPGNLGNVIARRRTLYLPDIEKSSPTTPRTFPRLNATPTHSYVGVPLILRDKVIGVMSLLSSKAEAYSQEQIELLETVAVQAAIAISNARLYAEVQRLAIVDELTGLYNYRGLVALGTREVERARRFDRPLCAIFFDIDGFKDFNNRYNHSTGNLILQSVAKCCLASMRTVDLIARYGGDEFVVLLPETDIQAGHEAALRLSQAVAGCVAPTRFGDLSVTVSLGLAGLEPGMENLAVLLDRANRAEHQAKEKGAGQVVVA